MGDNIRETKKLDKAGYSRHKSTPAGEEMHTKAPSSNFSTPECATGTPVHMKSQHGFSPNYYNPEYLSLLVGAPCALSFIFQTGKTHQIIDPLMIKVKCAKECDILTEKLEGARKAGPKAVMLTRTW